ncbi:ATP-binding cassette sub-family G member 1 [Halotydeus destructor]|nr:ATP-binding cassette sub-family G member 1 [Halotydeus destructor]
MTCINLLKNLAKKKSMAVMAIIHQPSNEVFTTFDLLYLLSNAGERLFFGPPDQLLPLFLSLDIECPKKQSIPELAIKVANSGLKDALLAEKLDQFRKYPNEGNALNTLMIRAVFSWRHVGLLLSRAFISLNFRSPFLAITILFHVASALMVAFSTKIPFGLIDGCQVSINGTLSRDELKMTYVDQLEANNTLKAFVVSPVFYLLIVIPVISAIRFPLEFRVMRRELDNKWYSTSSYVTAKVLGSISECVLLTPVFAGILFYFSEQRVEAWRAVSWLSIIILSSIYNFVVGLLCGVVFKDDLEMAVLTSVLNFFTFIVSKCFVNTEHMSAVFQYLLPLNVFDLAVSATASVMYGFGRCPPPPTDAVSLYEVMSDSRNPYKVISKAYEDANFTNEYVTTVANILDVDDQKLLSLKVSLDEYFTRQPKPKSTAVASYVLEYLGIDNDGLFENLIFASKIHFRSMNLEEHTENVKLVLKQLDLEMTWETVTKNLSGGQLKRLAIGLEIISNPDILILDEPTTGLDSANAVICTNLLKKLATEKSMAVLAIIHQPSNEVFLTFDRLYLLSNEGERLFFGSPNQLLPLLQTKGIVCPKKYSIPEFAIKVANSDMKEVLVTIEDINSVEYHHSSQVTLNKLKEETSFCKHQVALVFARGFVGMNLKSPFLLISMVLCSLTALMVSFCTKIPFGKEDGCQLQLNDTLTLNQLKVLYRAKFDATNGLKIFLLGPPGYMLLVTTVVSCIEFPLEYRTLKRELDNKWYSASSYLTGRYFCGILESCITSAIFILILFYATEQHVENWRLVSWLSIVTLNSIYHWTLGFLFGIIFRDDMAMAVLSSVVFFFTFFISRFFVSYAEMSKVIRLILPFNVFDLTVSASASVMYGFGRCPSLSPDSISVYEALADSRSPFKIVSKSYQDTGFTDDDIERWAPIVDIDTSILRSFKTAIDGYFANQPKLSVPEVASYILEELDVHEDGRECWKQVCLLLSQIAIIIFISYVKLNKVSK